MDLVEYNEFLRQEFEKNGDIETLRKYVLTEVLAPIYDQENAVRIIRKYKDTYQDPTLLIIGAYVLTEWLFDEIHNDFLDDLNQMRDRLTDRELAIMYYLNAYHMEGRREDGYYADRPEYRENLLRSVACKEPLVNNRMDLARISTEEERKRLYAEALSNVVKVDSLEEIMAMPHEAFAEPDQFINEFITGTHPNDTHYKHLVRSASYINVKYLMHHTGMEEVMEIIRLHYGEQEIPRLEQLYREIRTWYPDSNDEGEAIVIKAIPAGKGREAALNTFDERDRSLRFDVSGIKPGDDTEYSIAGVSERQYLSFAVAPEMLKRMSYASVLAHSLWEMTSPERENRGNG